MSDGGLRRDDPGHGDPLRVPPGTPAPGVALGHPPSAPPASALTARARRGVDPSGIVVALGLLALAGVLWWDASRLPEARGYAGMGPADTPRVVGAALALLGLWAAWEAVRAPEPPAPQQDVPALLWIVGGLGLQLLLIRGAGFSIASGLLFACVAAAFGRRKLWVTIPVGIAFALAVFAVFALLLQLSLPPGPLERLIFRV